MSGQSVEERAAEVIAAHLTAVYGYSEVDPMRLAIALRPLLVSDDLERRPTDYDELNEAEALDVRAAADRVLAERAERPQA